MARDGEDLPADCCNYQYVTDDVACFAGNLYVVTKPAYNEPGVELMFQKSRYLAYI